MFFIIASEHKQNYSNHYQLGSFAISTDSGWQQQGKYLYKGYADNYHLSSNLDLLTDSRPSPHNGNYTILKLVNNTLELHTSKYRSYPLYVNSNDITNLTPGPKQLWADKIVTVYSDMSVVEKKFNLIGNIDTSPLTFSQAINIVDELLNNKIYNFLQHNTLPINAYLSGGVDSLLVYSYLKKHTDHFNLVKGVYFEYDDFWMKNSGTILSANYWGYKQIHHWSSPTILTSGTSGDEFMLRSPQTVTWLLQNAGYNVPEVITNVKYKSAMQFSYFNRLKNIELFSQRVESIVPHSELIFRICNNIVNDFQHWHIGNTLTWTPLRDLDITKIMLRIPAVELIDQIMNSAFSTQLIEKNNPGLSTCVSAQKNTGNELENLYKIYNDHS